MKFRKEARGLHLYDRVNGIHVLFDEIKFSETEWDKAPVTVSIALTNTCDLPCHFCYAPKNNQALPVNNIISWSKELAEAGTFELAFGGGEPTLYPQLANLCQKIWSSTDLGISITTHGHHLSDDLVTSLQGVVSIIRVSVDAPEPYYSAIRRRPLACVLQNLERLAQKIPVGLNTVVNTATLSHLDEMARLVRGLGVIDWLLLPEVHAGRFTLNTNEWHALDTWIKTNGHGLKLCLASDAMTYLSAPSLLDARLDDHAHISADGYLRRCSYLRGGIELRGKTMLQALGDLRTKESQQCQT